MDIRSALAVQNYATARPATAPKEGPAGQGTGLTDFAQKFADTLSEGETTAKAAMTGDADPHALVHALAETELAVETAVTVRDKVVEAYQEILRMPV
ncbi:MAG: flagellar hook-basal body complex protein FliE [Pseudomonadota bacterium]